MLQNIMKMLYYVLCQFLFGYINNFVPVAITQHLTNKIQDKMLHSTFQYGLGTIAIFPIWYIILLVVVSVLTHHFWIGLVYIALAGILGILNAHYKRALRKLGNVFRALRMKGSEAYQMLCALNTKIMGTMEKLLF